MTEPGWLSGDDPRRLMRQVWDRCHGEDRKLRLFAVACCRRIAPLIPDGPCQAALEASARYAEGAATQDELARASEAAWNDPGRGGPGPDTPGVSALAESAALLASALPGYAGIIHTPDAVRRVVAAAGGDVAEEARAQCALLRDVFGDLPDRPALRPDWLAWEGGTVRMIARAIYDEERFGDLPVLGDALENAGCEEARLLAHCREPGLHARGCWLLDLVLRGRGG
jgi:hypothetical protein